MRRIRLPLNQCFSGSSSSHSFIAGRLINGGTHFTLYLRVFFATLISKDLSPRPFYLGIDDHPPRFADPPYSFLVSPSARSLAQQHNHDGSSTVASAPSFQQALFESRPCLAGEMIAARRPQGDLPGQLTSIPGRSPQGCRNLATSNVTSEHCFSFRDLGRGFYRAPQLDPSPGGSDEGHHSEGQPRRWPLRNENKKKLTVLPYASEDERD